MIRVGMIRSLKTFEEEMAELYNRSMKPDIKWSVFECTSVVPSVLWQFMVHYFPICLSRCICIVYRVFVKINYQQQAFFLVSLPVFSLKSAFFLRMSSTTAILFLDSLSIFPNCFMQLAVSSSNTSRTPCPVFALTIFVGMLCFKENLASSSYLTLIIDYSQSALFPTTKIFTSFSAYLAISSSQNSSMFSNVLGYCKSNTIIIPWECL